LLKEKTASRFECWLTCTSLPHETMLLYICLLCFRYFSRWMRLSMCTAVSTVTMVVSEFPMKTPDTWELVKLLCPHAHSVVGMIYINLLEWSILLLERYLSIQDSQ
jgi:hypothetical protein